MPMSSYEVVRRAIEFECPDRIPIRQPQYGVSDVATLAWRQLCTGDRSLRESLDEWGCLWTRTDVPNMGQITYHPLADWDAMADFNWPDPNDPLLYAHMNRDAENLDGDKYVTTEIFMLLFERLHAVHGFENTLLDLYQNRTRLEELADRIVEYDIGILRHVAERFPGVVHALRFSDDWGTERDVFIHPELWRDFFQPRYRQIFDFAHEKGWHVWMHTCGKVNGIIEGLIEAGLEVINLMQPRCLGIEEIGAQFCGRICFETHCDAQVTLPSNDAKAIRAEARLLLEHWAVPEGGFIYSFYERGEGIGADPSVGDIMLEEFRAADPWRRNREAETLS